MDSDEDAMNTAKDGKDIAGVIAPPPLIYLIPLALAFAIDWAVGAHMGLGRAGLVIGLVIAALAGGLALWARRQFTKGGTSLRTEVPSEAILTGGPFRFSRNPLYVALALLQVGIGIATDLAWIIVMLVPALLVIRYGVIAREERYLERKFGEQYLSYTRRVRRWV